MDIVEAAQIRALLSVIQQDTEYHVRRIQRWYSKTFATPLHEVEDLPLEDVLLVYFEEAFESMPEKKRVTLAIELTQTPEEKVAAEKAQKEAEEAASDEAFLKEIQEKASKEESNQAALQAKEFELAAKMMRELGELDGLAGTNPPPLPDIEMTFDNDNLLGGEEDSIPAPPPRKR